jgi:hypothetical protein
VDPQAGGGAPPPTIVGGRYELRQRLDTAAGPVQLTAWLGYDQILHRQVRVDLHTPGGEAARSVVDHALASGAITHPALARVLDVADDGDQAYVVSAWIDGAPLPTLLGAGPLPPADAAAVLGQIADGIAAAHRAGTTVGVVEAEQVVVDDVERASLVRLPLPASTPQDDVRGLGALLYAALTAHWPLDSNAGGLPTAPIVEGRLATPQQVIPAVPTDLSATAMRALYPEHPEGIATAEEFAALLAGSPALTAPPPDVLPLPGVITAPPVPRRRKRQWLRVGAPIAAVVAVGLVTWLVAAFAIPNSSPPDSSTRAPYSIPSVAPSSDEPTLPDHSSNSSATAATTAPPTTTATTPSSTTPPPLAAVKPAKVIGFDPYGEPPGDDNAKNAPLAADGNPDTMWQSDIYRRRADLGGLKPGTGVIFDLASPQALREIQFTTAFAGMDVQILSSTTMPTSPDKMHKVATVTNVKASNTVKITDTTEARYWVVWITKLAPVGDSHYRGGLSEVRFYR